MKPNKENPGVFPSSGLHAQFSLRYCGPDASAFSLDVDLALPGSGITAIFGHSGSGKTTLLRCIAGLEHAKQGCLSVNGAIWQSHSVFLPTHQRPLAYVFQESSLFKHLTAQGNLNYALKRSRVSNSTSLYDKVITLMGIKHALQRYPHQLSGGERQRVAIARALLIQPRLLLMDEPLASLDHARKQEILPFLESLRANVDIPILYISHSLDEVTRLADHVVLLEQGQAVAQGSVEEIFSRIDLPLALGDDAGVVWQGTIMERNEQWQLARVNCAGGQLWVRDSGDALGTSMRIRILARDVSLTLSCHEDSSILNRLPVVVVAMAPDKDDAMTLVRLQAGEDFAIARLTRRSAEHLNLVPGLKLWAQIKSVALIR